MDQEILQSAPDHETTWTLYRFCLSRGLSLNHHERSVAGVELSQLAREQRLPFRKVRSGSAPASGARAASIPSRS